MKRLLTLLLALMMLVPQAFSEESSSSEVAEAESVVVTSEGRELQYKDKGDDVKLLQTRLKDLYYYKGPVTGQYLDATRKSIRAVQEAYGLEVTGKADMALQQIIYGDAHRPLAKGDSGKDVNRLQTRLGELGYYLAKVTGNYLNVTMDAVKRFQRENGLPDTGKADIATLTKLYSDDIVMPTPDPLATPAPVPTLPPDIEYKGVVSYGDKNDRVAKVQERLAALGFFDRKVTGGFYQHTNTSVKEFQKYNGIKPDGVVGEDTWKAMFSMDAVTSSATPKPTPEPTPVPYFVEVDVNNQLIKIFSRDTMGDFTNLEKIFHCSTGTTSYPSKPGTYTLTGRKARWAEFPNWGGGKARWWVRIDSEIAFHSIIYRSNNLNDVNMNSVRKLGSRASHGCIRLTVADAKWIYDHIGAGTQVYIHEDAPMDPELKAANKPGSFNTSTYLHNATPVPTQEPVFDGSRPPEVELRNLKSGAEGYDVFWLQSKLKEMGYYHGTVTGTYLEGTKAAVRAFQRDFKLNANGNADKKTLQALYDWVIAVHATEAPPLPAETPGEVDAPAAEQTQGADNLVQVAPTVSPAP